MTCGTNCRPEGSFDLIINAWIKLIRYHKTGASTIDYGNNLSIFPDWQVHTPLSLCLGFVQGRIQDLKLGVAKMDWKILKKKGGGDKYIKNAIIIYIYIWNTYISFKYAFQYNIIYLTPPYL